jgi:hypothetical protein
MANAKPFINAVKGLAVTIDPQVGALLAQLRSPMAHCRQNQMSLRPVEAPAGEYASGFDHDHLLIWTIQEMWTELVSKQPTRTHRLSKAHPWSPCHCRSPRR